MTSRTFVRSAAVLSALALGLGPALAGPLNPPAGSVASTPGPEPRIAINDTNTPGDANSRFKITQPGSYYLTGNITGVALKHGIEIDASGVTIDLNGFVLIGVDSSLCGITTEGTRNDITIINGHIKSWGDSGINLTIGGLGNNTIIERVTSSQNGNTGIYGSSNAVIRSCVARSNGTVGISAGEGATISQCSSRLNGTYGYSASSAATITDCSATENQRNGISADYGATISDCVAMENGWEGIVVYFGGTITRCSARLNVQNGIKASFGSSIIDCTASDNVLDGITVGSRNTVRGNTCTSNGTTDTVAAGINATGSDNRIEANSCSFNDFGIDIDSAGNVIIRNTCADNTQNFVFVPNNIHGPIIDRTAPASPAVVGNSAGGTMGTTDHNANFAL